MNRRNWRLLSFQVIPPICFMHLGSPRIQDTREVVFAQGQRQDRRATSTYVPWQRHSNLFFFFFYVVSCCLEFDLLVGLQLMFCLFLQIWDDMKRPRHHARIMRAACGIHCGDLEATLESTLSSTAGYRSSIGQFLPVRLALNATQI